MKATDKRVEGASSLPVLSHMLLQPSIRKCIIHDVLADETMTFI